MAAVRAELTTLAGEPGRSSEDFAGMTLSDPGGALVVLDGVGSSGAGCRHGVPWFARRLGGSLLELASARPADSLSTCLAVAIERTADAHRSGCDLSQVRTPQSTVVAVRWNEKELEHLVLSDSILLLHTEDGTVRHIVDRPLDRVSPDMLRRLDAARHAATTSRPGCPEQKAADREYRAMGEALRNVEGGFFTAAAEPAVAVRALTGVTSLADIRAVAAMTDGAGRWVEKFGLGTWLDCMDRLYEGGTRELIARVRAVESSCATVDRYEKSSDDASAVLVVFQPRENARSR